MTHTVEGYRLLAGVIAAHPSKRLVGRTRLQKTVKLLQRVGFPTNYVFKTHYYGPYSQDVQADVTLLENLGLVTEKVRMGHDGREYYEFEASEGTHLAEPLREKFGAYIEMLSEVTDATVLELAATYDAFREQGFEHLEALKRLRHMKQEKCTKDRLEAAMFLLKRLGLS